MAQKQRLVAGHHSRVAMADTEDDEECEEVDYRDYYDHLSQSEAIRPICITEGVDFDSMSLLGRIGWWIGSFFKLLSIIVLSVRTDRLCDRRYMRRHYIHYLGMLIFALAAWSPQVIDFLSNMGVLEKGLLTMSPIPAYIICIVTLHYYIISISLFFIVIGPWMRAKVGVAATLRFWEYFVSVSWQLQTLGFFVLTLIPPIMEAEMACVPTSLTTGLGIFLVIIGIGAKMGAIAGTGYNTYYWYDMVTGLPNAYFVEVGIYKYVGSPTYTLGRGTSFGAALHYRSLPMLGAALLDLLLINLFNKLVEQPSVRRMYGGGGDEENDRKK